MLINIDGENGSYLDVDMWYGDEFQPMRYGASAVFNDMDSTTRGNIYNDAGEMIGDYKSNDSALVGKNFPIDFDMDSDVEACNDINCTSKPKYTADMCSIGASSGSYPYYIDKEGVFEGYFDDQTDVLSIFDLQNIYDTLVADGDVSALSFGSFDEWLQANVDKGLLSGMWMSDAQRCDMPAEFGGYYPDEDYEEDEFDDNIYRVTFPNSDEAVAAEALLDTEGVWYDWGDGDRMLLRIDGLTLLEGSDIDFDEM